MKNYGVWGLGNNNLFIKVIYCQNLGIKNMK